MHYCCHLYTKEFPTDGVIENAMAPYYEERYYEERETDESISRPVILYDYYIVGGRYGGVLKLDWTKEKYKPHCFLPYKRAGRLFRSAYLERTAYGTLEWTDWLKVRDNKLEELYAMQYCGAKEGSDGMRVDGALICDLTNFNEIADACYCVIDTDGKAYARETFDRDNWVDTPNFDETVKAIVEKNRENDCYLTVIDIHD